MSEKMGENSVVIDKIRNDQEYDQIHHQMHALIDLGFDNLTHDQEVLLDYFANLIEAYDRDHEAD